MSYAKEYDWLPISSSIPEFHFGGISEVNMWIEFETTNFEIWRGSFECGEKGLRKILEISDKNYLIIANGKGYIINNDLKTLQTEIELEGILSIKKINETEYLIVNWEGIYVMDIKGNLKVISKLIFLDEFNIESENEKEIIAQFISSIYQWKIMYFIFNKELKTYKIKRKH